jgi:hypothetical protein
VISCSHAVDPDRRLSIVVGLVSGIALLGGGLFVRQREAREQATMVEVKGVVVASSSRRDLEKDVVLYSPVVEFEVNGAKHRVTGKEESSNPQADGNVAVVRFEASAPDETARVIGALEGLVPAALFVLGGLSLLAAVRELWRGRGAKPGQV